MFSLNTRLIKKKYCIFKKEEEGKNIFLDRKDDSSRNKTTIV